MSEGTKAGRTPSRRVQRKRERSQQEILAAAREVLQDQGVEAVTLASVAGKLGLTKPALYHYFPSKEVLVRHLTVLLLSDEIEALLAAVEAEPSGTRVLGVMIRAFYRHYIDRLNEFRMIYCASQLYTLPQEVIDSDVLASEINPRTRELFDVLEARLSNNSRSAARRAKYRRLAFSAWLGALGLVTMLGVTRAAQDPLVHTDADLLDALATTFDNSAA